ncbi:MAG: RNA polymerase sigma factor [Alphaproteobacteria bacterium]|nr:RNA polymerase sigma factor [Alphaproteobacteria bacterium]
MLVKKHKEPLYRFVRRYVGQADDAYDILQDSFVSAWTALPRYDPKRPFAPWLHRIALNKCRDFGRRQAVRRALLRIVAVEPPDVSQSDAEIIDAEAQASNKLRRLNKAVADLPARYKEPLLLTAMEGRSHDEAAQMLGISSKAVEMRVYRARHQLRQAMGEEEAEG